MKRDWDVVRKILLKLEELEDTSSQLEPDKINGSDEETVSYHMHLLDQAGLIKAKCSGRNPLNCVALSLTWKGHEFLDKIRQDTVWNQVKKAAREKSISLSIDVIASLADRVISSIISGDVGG